VLFCLSVFCVSAFYVYVFIFRVYVFCVSAFCVYVCVLSCASIPTIFSSWLLFMLSVCYVRVCVLCVCVCTCPLAWNALYNHSFMHVTEQVCIFLPLCWTGQVKRSIILLPTHKTVTYA